ncbi:ATP-binding protein [Myxococcus sp. K38C18041901]|uniref:sensor histidine kinase n=1 Tax=Myxococcus guangdongensis TaxID=2906760 RepID=UPI0020A73965|nr:ATP-binding protein [Myxococcus guangdongensis]MCP3059357.1 ATP-binding protein [Myxococcus guangdongensis]
MSVDPKQPQERLRCLEHTVLRQEKLAALGRHAAGLAHEMNNPASAGRRATEQLTQAMDSQEDLSVALDQWRLTQAQRQQLLRTCRQSQGRGATRDMDPLARGDAEDALATWMDAKGVVNAWDLSPTLLDAGIGEAQLEPLTQALPAEAIPDALAWLEALVRTRALLAEVRQSTTRLAELAGAVKSYTHAGKEQPEPVDVHEGLENTLLLLNYKLKHGVEVKREYDRSLPRVQALPGMLNHVWTNLVDNAIDAMGGKGHLTVRTAKDQGSLLVEVVDDGPGVPPELLERIWEPFFTTKPMGQGTGLGLDIIRRVVVDRHHGDVRVESKPGRTAFQIRLPLK